MKFISPSRTIQIAIAEAVSAIFGISLDPIKISLEISYPKYNAHYTSAIALALSNRLNLNPLQIAEVIAQICSQNVNISAQWQIQAVGKGWLNIFLSEQYLAECGLALAKWQIERIIDCDGFWQKCDVPIISINESVEPTVQYAYARCCALIRLAHRENVGTIDQLPLHLPNRFLACLETTEISLLMQNLEIAAYLESEHSVNKNKSRTKLSRSLAEAFLQFYDRCRIFGVPQEIAARRIFLIRITQKLLLAIAPLEINYAMYL